MSATCETCRYAMRYPDPGERPVLPDPPTERTGWRRFWFGSGAEGSLARFYRERPLMEWESAKEIADTRAECWRYPRAEDVPLDNWCGEHEHQPLTERTGA